MGTYTKNLKLETPNYTDNADIPALTKKNNEIIDSEMIKRANGLDYNEQTGVLQLTGNNSKVGSPIQIKNNLPVTSMSSGTELKVNNYKQLIKFTKEGKTEQKTYTGKSIIAYDNSTKSMSSNPLNGISVSIDDQGIITLNGTSTDAVSFQISKSIENVLKANNNYSFYVENLGGTQSNQFSMILYGKNGTTATNLNSTVSTTTGKIVKTITPKEDYSLAYFWFYCVKGITFNNLKVRLMLVEGSYTADTIGDYEPYVGAIASPNPDYPSEIISIPSVENLLQTKEETITSSGVNIELKHENLKAKGTTNGSILYRIMNKNILLKAGTYTFSWVNKGITPLKDSSQLIFSKSSTDRIVTFNLWTTTNYKTITFTEDTILDFNYCYLYVNNNNSIDLDLEIMIEKGTIAHPWRPYGNYLRIDNNNEPIFVNMQDKKLCSNKDETIKDELIIYDNGKTEINKKIGEVILDGSVMGIGLNATLNNVVRFTIGNLISTNNSPLQAISSHFKYEYNFSSDTEHFYIGSTGVIFIFISKDKVSTIDDFKTWLSNNPVKIQYELAEPETIDLGITDFNLLDGNSELTCEDESNMQLDYLTIDSNVFIQDSLVGNSSKKAPSVRAVNESIKEIKDYTATEQIIGTWFGKTLYRKCFEITMQESETMKAVETGISNMFQLTHAYGSALLQGTIWIPLNFYNGANGWNSFHVTGNGSTIQIQRGSEYPTTSVMIILEYTKNE